MRDIQKGSVNLKKKQEVEINKTEHIPSRRWNVKYLYDE